MKKLLTLHRLCGTCMLSAASLVGLSVEASTLTILNAGFESDTAPAVGATGWTITSGGTDWFTTTAGQPDSSNDPDAAAEGANWLSGNRLATGAGSSSNPQVIEQLVDISADAALVDSGAARLSLSFMFSDSDPNDDGEIKALFYSDIAGISPLAGDLASGVLAPTAPDNTAMAPWDIRNLVGVVPTGARSVKIELVNTRASGSAGNVHFDDFSGAIVPEPTAAMLIAFGACLIAARATSR
ncbi:hypothetical protein Pla123a_41340 [Posidoniimonas polymericola]|uniref:PEP-CTERM protein-sorting domain-containing protein n=1 Tax=Posidoniimonas polymericola TaxID=2528002 RepID=A0A5C5YDG0_9BACT|nr:hypothetical protein [Posidoniimonas polymericola]TWT72833.1 hypothetical protein Pla123a_41340 [Posidoniimonas polymericola]